jgi:glutamine synthetase
VPDLSTLSVVPWETDPTAQVICDIVSTRMALGRSFTPRNVLKRVMKPIHERGWKPVVAPEIEFYLVAKNDDPDYPLHPPKGRSGRAILGGQGYSIAGINEFDELIDDIYHFSEKQGLEIDTLIHEEGAGAAGNQPAPRRPDRACRPGVPVQADDPRGGAEARHLRHLHGQADAGPARIGDAHPPVGHRQETGKNIFSPGRLAFEGVLPLHRRHAEIRAERAGDAGALRQLLPPADARHVVRRSTMPGATTTARRPSACRARIRRRGVSKTAAEFGCQPYLALAASLACGLLGIMKEIEPTAPTEDSANEGSIELPRGLLEAVSLMEDEPAFEEIFGREFIGLYAGVKRGEFETFMQVISPWEREFLLLNV